MKVWSRTAVELLVETSEVEVPPQKIGSQVEVFPYKKEKEKKSTNTEHMTPFTRLKEKVDEEQQVVHQETNMLCPIRGPSCDEFHTTAITTRGSIHASLPDLKCNLCRAALLLKSQNTAHSYTL